MNGVINRQKHFAVRKTAVRLHNIYGYVLNALELLAYTVDVGYAQDIRRCWRSFSIGNRGVPEIVSQFHRQHFSNLLILKINSRFVSFKIHTKDRIFVHVSSQYTIHVLHNELNCAIRCPTASLSVCFSVCPFVHVT